GVSRIVSGERTRMKRLLPIGRFAQITRLTPKALRLYDEMCLLPPAVVDADSSYRYYSLDQIGVASQIRLLRSLDMPLEEIAQVLQTQDPLAVQALIADHRRHVAARIARDQQILATLDALVCRAEPVQYSVAVKRVPAQPILSIQAGTALSELDGTMPQAMQEIHAYLRRCGLRTAGPDFCAYPYPEAGHDDFIAEACVPTGEPVPGQGRIRSGELPAGPVAFVVHPGPYQSLPLAFQAVLEWIQDHGHDVCGPLREIYLVDAADTGSPLDFRTEVAWPI